MYHFDTADVFNAYFDAFSSTVLTVILWMFIFAFVFGNRAPLHPLIKLTHLQLPGRLSPLAPRSSPAVAPHELDKHRACHHAVHEDQPLRIVHPLSCTCDSLCPGLLGTFKSGTTIFKVATSSFLQEFESQQVVDDIFDVFEAQHMVTCYLQAVCTWLERQLAADIVTPSIHAFAYDYDALVYMQASGYANQDLSSTIVKKTEDSPLLYYLAFSPNFDQDLFQRFDDAQGRFRRGQDFNGMNSYDAVKQAWFGHTQRSYNISWVRNPIMVKWLQYLAIMFSAGYVLLWIIWGIHSLRKMKAEKRTLELERCASSLISPSLGERMVTFAAPDCSS
eukprot:gene2822-77_t